MQDLARIELIEERSNVVFRLSRILSVIQARRDMITGSIRGEMGTSERIDLAQERRLQDADRPQGLEVARSRGFQVNAAVRLCRADVVDAELIGTRMETQLVGAK